MALRNMHGERKKGGMKEEKKGEKGKRKRREKGWGREVTLGISLFFLSLRLYFFIFLPSLLLIRHSIS